MATIAVVGGGVGGLAVAYNIMANWIAEGSPPDTKPTVTVYEATDRFGGNGNTATFTLGNIPNIFPAKAYNRWADLGVSDFNVNTYRNIVDVMSKIGFVEGKDYAPLEDSTSYYTLDGSIVYTTGQTLVDNNTTDIPLKLQRAIDKFMSQAPKDAKEGGYGEYPVRKYISKVFSKYPEYDERLGPHIIYPRISGMYFANDVDPASLPLKAVMTYYELLEGAGQNEKPRRMYFREGASSWIEALRKYMRDTLHVNFVQNFPVALSFKDGIWTLENTLTEDTVTAEKVVVATHADDALKLFKSGASADVLSCLGQIKHQDALSVAHTFAGVLPNDPNAWKTYNFVIHNEGTEDAEDTNLKPYSITCVCNRHQNDGENPKYNHFGGPQFFVTVNSPVPIPKKYVLVDQKTKKRAIAKLRHWVYDLACIGAQKTISKLQGKNNLYFAGGWTRGAGLHEECWIQGQDIANLILPGHKAREEKNMLSAPQLIAPIANALSNVQVSMWANDQMPVAGVRSIIHSY